MEPCMFPMEDITNVRTSRESERIATPSVRPPRPPPRVERPYPRGKENRPPSAPSVHPWFAVPEFVRRAVERAAGEAGEGADALRTLCRCEMCLDRLSVAFVPHTESASHVHAAAVCGSCATAVAAAAKGEGMDCPLCVKSLRKPPCRLVAPYFRFCDQRTIVALVAGRWME
eukprot:jgi/Mesvir1/13614/Mv26230-RA.1